MNKRIAQLEKEVEVKEVQIEGLEKIKIRKPTSLSFYRERFAR